MALETRPFQFANFSRSTLAGDISAAATEIHLQEGDGDLFPTLEYDYSQICSIMLFAEGRFEVAYATARDGDILTVERGKEGTSPLGFSAGDTVVHSVTKGFLEYLRDYVPPTPPPSVSSFAMVVGNASGSDILYGTSDDDITSWSFAASAFGGFSAPDAKGLAYGNGTFVMAGDAGFGGQKLLYSTDDGATWSEGTFSPTNQDLTGIDYSSSLDMFVAVAILGNIHRSTDGGATWTTVAPNGVDLRDVCWTGTEFVAVGDTNEIILSTDGASWSDAAAKPSPAPAQILAVTSNGSRIIIGDSNGDVWYSDNDGASWSSAKATGLGRVERLASDQAGNIIAINQGGSSAVAYSSDGGDSWSTTGAVINTAGGIAYEEGYGFLLVGTNASGEIVVYSSADGASWTLRGTYTGSSVFTAIGVAGKNEVYS